MRSVWTMGPVSCATKFFWTAMKVYCQLKQYLEGKACDVNVEHNRSDGCFR